MSKIYVPFIIIASNYAISHILHQNECFTLIGFIFSLTTLKRRLFNA